MNNALENLMCRVLGPPATVYSSKQAYLIVVCGMRDDWRDAINRFKQA